MQDEVILLCKDTRKMNSEFTKLAKLKQATEKNKNRNAKSKFLKVVKPVEPATDGFLNILHKDWKSLNAIEQSEIFNDI